MKSLLVVAALALTAPAAARADPPQCSGGTAVVAPGQPKTLDFPSCDGAGDNPVVTVVSPPIGGTVTGNPFVYTPAPGFVGVDQFRYTVKNTTTGETSAETTVNLVVNTPPACGDGTATTAAGQPLRIAFSAFPCSDADGSGNLFIHVSDGAHGTVVSDFGAREVVYTPDPGFEGTDEFSFYAADSITQTATRTMRVTVGQTAPPTATPTPVTSDRTPPPPASADTTAPKTTAKAVSASIAKGVTLTLASNEAGTAKLTLSVDKATARKLKLDRKAKGAVNIGSGTANLVNGPTKITVKFTAKARRALKRVRNLKAKLTVVATDAAGNSATTTLTVVAKSTSS